MLNLTKSISELLQMKPAVWSDLGFTLYTTIIFKGVLAYSISVITILLVFYVRTEHLNSVLRFDEINGDKKGPIETFAKIFEHIDRR